MPNIEVNGKTYTVEVAITEEEKEQGLQNVTSLEDNQGMLFCYDPPQSTSFWMKNTIIPLDIIFIDEYNEVISVQQGQPNDETPIFEDNVAYVLEVNQGSGISSGDDVDLSEVEEEMEMEYKDDPEESDSTIMIVIGEKGNSQMELSGGERIFSRPNTKTLVKLSKKAYKSKKDSDYKALGRKVFQYIETQNTQEPEYVQS
jgi:uncharacterized membrane protein (UPF0127 family)